MKKTTTTTTDKTTALSLPALLLSMALELEPHRYTQDVLLMRYRLLLSHTMQLDATLIG